MKKIAVLMFCTLYVALLQSQKNPDNWVMPLKFARTNIGTGDLKDCGHTITVSNDTILIYQVINTTIHNSTLATFKVVNNQIVAKVFETIDYETNAGSIRSHYKKLDKTLYIDICELFDNCKDETDTFVSKKKFFPEYEGKFVETQFYPIPQDFSQMIKRWNRIPELKDY